MEALTSKQTIRKSVRKLAVQYWR